MAIISESSLYFSYSIKFLYNYAFLVVSFIIYIYSWFRLRKYEIRDTYMFEEDLSRSREN